MQFATRTACGLCLAVLLACGCQNQQVAATNPFVSADRVPPPATRLAEPAAPQAYYQPTLSAAPPQDAGVGAEAQAIAAAPAPRQPATFAPAEGAVALPADDQPLRMAFTPPAAPPTPTAPLANATYPPGAPAITASPTNDAPIDSPDFSPLQPAGGLAWGAGAMNPDTAATSNASPPMAVTQAAYVESGTPRVRLPGYVAPAGYAQAPVTAAPVGTVQITELPPAVYQAPAQPAPTYAGDGFQARGSSPNGSMTNGVY